MGSEIIGRGAEAIVFKVGNRVIKERIEKKYRIKSIDEKLRRQRTRREAKILEIARKKKIPAPILHRVDEDAMQIEMDFIEGKSVRDVLDVTIAFAVGKKVALLHNADIIHADLTTTNMIVKNNEVFLIDFGLSFISKKIEDKAVDLHLLERALESRHHDKYADCMRAVVLGYKENYPTANAVLERLEVVKKRGRNRK